ncbi:MAG: hypothetical protein RugAbin2_00064 [Rugosibacter sp.]|jgi:hypothetical protein|nr:hypothetical protein [Rugosibacter sp.]
MIRVEPSLSWNKKNKAENKLAKIARSIEIIAIFIRVPKLFPAIFPRDYADSLVEMTRDLSVNVSAKKSDS